MVFSEFYYKLLLEKYGIHQEIMMKSGTHPRNIFLKTSTQCHYTSCYMVIIHMK